MTTTIDRKIVRLLARTKCDDARDMLHAGMISQDAWEAYMEVWHDLPRETCWKPTDDPNVQAWIEALRAELDERP